MKLKFAAALLSTTIIAGSALAAEGPVPRGIAHLDHVWLIMMENHGYNQIIGNPSAPFINSEAAGANLATNYFAVGHPSLTNYLEVVGGSNFAVNNDHSPDWHNSACAPNLAGVPATEATAAAICPIAGVGADAATPAIDTTNETSGPPGDVNIDGTKSFAAAYGTTGKTIADQLTARRMSWKSYQESLPSQGADRVNNSDGTFTDQTVFSAAEQALGEKDSNVVSLYAVKHNPFVYFKSVQESPEALHNVVGFDGIDGLYGDLRSGDVPSFSFIAPNQCNDQHGRGNAGPWCNYDPNDQGTQSGLNPGLIKLGDATVQKLVTAIKGSPAWEEGNNAIVIVWDENDYSKLPTTNKVVAIVDTNRGGHDEHSEQTRAGHQSNRFYTHFSLLKTLEAGFNLPCLNHACDADAAVMSDLF